ncbi:MAG: cupin domain-containing protein [Candidatus Thermoplasmatota archaeon]|nr:cupin domain-containing protein [Candidatus Thermoplasmatota archaeon]
MKLINTKDVEMNEVKMKGVKDTQIQWLASKFDGAPNFAMRRFTMKPGGSIGLHDHPWEHEIYLLKGQGIAFTDKERVKIKEGNVIFMPGNEPHGYDNTGSEELVFICMIPNEGDPREGM